MTIEEKAKEESPYTKDTWQEGYNIWESGFKNGANWLLEKTINWLNDKVMFDEVGRPVKIEQFRKEMEE